MKSRRKNLINHLPTMAWLAVAWVLLWGEFSWGNILSGILLSIIITVVFPMPSIDYRGTVRPFRFAYLVLHFMWDLLFASLQVSKQVLNFKRIPRGAIVGVKLRTTSDLYLTIIAELSTLVPGTLVIEAHRLTGVLYLHVLDLEASGGKEQVEADLLALEARVLYAIASNKELIAAGLRPRPQGASENTTGGKA